MKFSLHAKDDPHRLLHLEAAPDALHIAYGEARFAQPVVCDVSVAKRGDAFVCHGEIRTVVGLDCDRCATAFDHRLSATLDLVIQRVSVGPAKDELDSDYVELPPHVSEYDLSDRVREAAILALPTHPLCQAGCRGLCPTCGRNLNAGPCACRPEVSESHWDELKKLKYSH